MKKLKSTKITLEVFKELKKILSGRCGNCCPNNILHEGNLRYYYNRRKKEGSRNVLKYSKISKERFCFTCEKEFHFLSAKRKTLCPCEREPNTEELFFRLDEFIEELEEKIQKEWN